MPTLFRYSVLLTSLIAVAGCETTGGNYPPAPPPPSQPMMTRAQGQQLYQELERNRQAIQALNQYVANLRHDVCVLGVVTEKVVVETDPANGLNRVRARRGAIRDPAQVCSK